MYYMYCRCEKGYSNTMTCRFVYLCHKANFGGKVEAGSALISYLSRSRPADALVKNWMSGIPAIFDVTVTS